MELSIPLIKQPKSQYKITKPLERLSKRGLFIFMINLKSSFLFGSLPKILPNHYPLKDALANLL